MSKMEMVELQTKQLELETGKFELEQRQAKALSVSAFFPDNLKNDVASAVIVYDLAKRMDISVMEVSQSIFIIYGRPSFATTFLVARLNQSGRIQGALRTIVSTDKQSAYCTAIDATTGEELVGMTVTMEMARKEGWVGKKGSKWVNMPELMLRKRSQSFFIKEYFPEVMFGLQTSEEVQDIEAIETQVVHSHDDINQALSQPVGKNEEEVIRNELIGKAQAAFSKDVIDVADAVHREMDDAMGMTPPKPKATRMPRFVTTHYERLEACGVKKKDVKEFAEHMDFVGMGAEKVTSFFTQTDSEITFYINDFYGIEQPTEAEYEEVSEEVEAPKPQASTVAPTQETNTQEPKAGVSLARYKGAIIAKGVHAEDVDEFFVWASITTDNIQQFMEDKGAVDELTGAFIAEAGYAD